jgi:hypothetical protein
MVLEKLVTRHGWLDAHMPNGNYVRLRNLPWPSGDKYEVYTATYRDHLIERCGSFDTYEEAYACFMSTTNQLLNALPKETA